MAKRLQNPVLLALPLVLAGCNVVGPAALSNGRSTYNAAINQTEDEQILSMIVHQRYDETSGMLAVSSVTANIRVGASVGTNIGIGPQSTYEGNLVPLSAGATYEENPTISYVPLRGGQFVEKMLAPIGLDQALLLSRASTDDMEILRIVVRRVNGLTNPLYLHESTSSSFEHFIDVYIDLRERGKIDVVQNSRGGYDLLVHDFSGDDATKVRDLFATVGIRTEVQPGRPIVLPLIYSVGAPRPDGLDIETPSVLDVIRAAADGIDVPQEHLADGIVRPPAVVKTGRPEFITIRSSKKRPDHAAVAVADKGWWYFIDARDARSKQGFIFLRALIGMRLDQAGPTQQAPVLTLPVGG